MSAADRIADNYERLADDNDKPSMFRFWVEKQIDGEWKLIPFAESNTVQYCHGYVDAMDSWYPSPPCRICKRISGAKFKVMRETTGRA